MASNNAFLGWLLVPALSLCPGPVTALDPQPPVVASLRMDGLPSSGICAVGRFSPNARFLTFSCEDGALAPDDTNGRYDAFLLDRWTGVIDRLSVSSSGQQMNFPSGARSPSNDGQLALFWGAGPLHPDYQPYPMLDTGPAAIYLRHRATGITDLISRDAFGQATTLAGATLYDAHFGQNEVLLGYTGDLRVGPTPIWGSASHIWVKNWVTDTVELISGTPTGNLSIGGASWASFSATGRYVVFRSTGDDLGPPARLDDQNIYLRDRLTGAIERLTWPWAGGEFQAPFRSGPRQPHISADGRFVVFSSNSVEIHPDGPGDGGTYVYLLDRQTGQLDFLSPTPGYPSYNINAKISDDGRYLAWSTRNGSFLGPPNPPADMRAIWVLDRHTGQRVNVTAPLGPLRTDGDVDLDLAPDGSAIAFTWRVADPAHPLFGRMPVFNVQLRGTQPAGPPTPVPASSPWLLLLLGSVMAFAALTRFRRDAHRRCR